MLRQEAEEGDLQSIRELVDRLDGKPVMSVDRHEVLIAAELTGAELLEIATGGRTDDELELKVLPPMSPND